MRGVIQAVRGFPQHNDLEKEIKIQHRVVFKRGIQGVHEVSRSIHAGTHEAFMRYSGYSGRAFLGSQQARDSVDVNNARNLACLPISKRLWL